MLIYQRISLISRILKPTVKKSSLLNLSSIQRFDHVRILLNKTPICGIHTTVIACKRRKTAEERKFPKLKEFAPKPKTEVVEVWNNVTVKELANILQKDVEFVEDIFLNQVRGGSTVLSDFKQLQTALKRAGKRVKIVRKPSAINVIKDINDEDIYPRPSPDPTITKPRPPVVTVMGHVDHGKTTLLDALRHTNVVEQEFGGITQHIGAFSVALASGSRVTFLDTPGHAAFKSMRERGANVTDIVVLVVAADDGVMEQTVESIRMARQSNVPILVAINKIDAPKADIKQTERMLIEVGIQVESMGGDVQSVPISALKRKNLDQLTEALSVQAELLQIRADYTGPVEAVVIESKLDVNRGKICTLIVQRGTLTPKDILVAGTAIAKVRNLRDFDGNLVDKITPGFPAVVEGWRDLPSAGAQVLQVESERQAKRVVEVRQEKIEEEKMRRDAEDIKAKREQHLREYKEKLNLKRKLGRLKLKPEGPRKPEIEEDNTPRFKVILKCDVDGSLEAVLNALDTYESDVCPLDLVHYDVGDVSEGDIHLATTFNAVIYAFNVGSLQNCEDLAKESNVPIKRHNVIYKLIDDVKEEINKRLPLTEVEEVVGEAEVLQQFIVNEGRKKIPIAGSKCVKGQLKRSSKYRLIRKGEVIYDGSLLSMRHLKNEVDVIKTNLECGLQLDNKEIQFECGDKLICYEKRMEPQKTTWDPGF